MEAQFIDTVPTARQRQILGFPAANERAEVGGGQDTGSGCMSLARPTKLQLSLAGFVCRPALMDVQDVHVAVCLRVPGYGRCDFLARHALLIEQGVGAKQDAHVHVLRRQHHILSTCNESCPVSVLVLVRAAEAMICMQELDGMSIDLPCFIGLGLHTLTSSNFMSAFTLSKRFRSWILTGSYLQAQPDQQPTASIWRGMVKR